MQALSRSDVEAAFQEIGEILLRAGKVADIAVYGGAVMLARSSGITSFDDMIALLGRYFPKEPPDARRVAVVGQFAERLNAPPSSDAG